MPNWRPRIRLEPRLCTRVPVRGTRRRAPTRQPWIISCKPVTSTEPSEFCTITWHTNGFPAQVQALAPGWGGFLKRTSGLTVLVWSITPLRSGWPGGSRSRVGGSPKLRARAGERDSDFEIRLAGVDAQWHGMRGEPDPILAFERDVFSRLTPGTDFVLDQFPVLSARAHLYKEDPDSCIATCDVALGHADPVTARCCWGSGLEASSSSVSLRQARVAASAALDAARARGVPQPRRPL